MCAYGCVENNNKTNNRNYLPDISFFRFLSTAAARTYIETIYLLCVCVCVYVCQQQYRKQQ